MKHVTTEIKLNNGAQGLFIHIPDASVMTFEVNFRAGEYLVDRNKWETPHLMEHVLLGANQLYPNARAFLAEFEKNGAYSNASTGSYDIIYEAECADFEWKRVLELLLLAITKPLFLDDEFQAEFGNVREELTARSNNHFRHLSLALREQYGFAIMTDQERLTLMKNVHVVDVRNHYSATHTSSNMRFIIAGNIDATRSKFIQNIISQIQLPLGNGRELLPQEKPKRLPKTLYIDNKTVDNLYFYIDTFMLRRMTDPESDALNLVNTMLTETLYSRILGTARERGLVYDMSSGLSQTSQNANWWFGAQIMSRNVLALLDIMKNEISQIFSGDISKSDLEGAKQYSLGRYQRSGQTVGGTANGYSYRYFFDDVVDDYYKLPERIKNVTSDQIVDVVRGMFADNVWGIGVLGNTGQEFADNLRQQIRSLWKI